MLVLQDELKDRVEILEKQLAEQRATESILELQGKVPTNDEVLVVCRIKRYEISCKLSIHNNKSL